MGSPVIVTFKPSGKIKLGVHMRQASEAKIRERLPIPNADEVLKELNGSSVFSKLDLHDGLSPHKRLRFGVNAAP